MWWPFSSSNNEQSQSQEPTSLEGTYKPMKREERAQCWQARDAYFKCLDKNNILDAVKDSQAAEEKCGKESQDFERDCASSWIVYFKQKRVSDFQRDLQLQRQGGPPATLPASSESQKSSWKFW